MINSSLTIRPKFDKNINSSLGLDYTLNKDVKSGFTSFQFNPFTDITSTITKKFSLGARVNYFYTDYAVERLNYVFSNFYAFYTIKPQKIEAKFSLVNLFNTNVALSGNVSTVISKSVSTQILPRFGLVEFTYKF